MPSPAAEVVRLALLDLAAGRSVDEVTAELGGRTDKRTAFDIAEFLLEVAADALELAAPTRADPVEYEGTRERYLPERPFRGKTEHSKSHYALRAAISIRAGFRPDIAGETSWWRQQDLWLWAWFATVIAVRLAAERTDQSVSEVVEAIVAERL